MERLVVTLKLQGGMQDRAAELIAAGPPFDPADLGVARHAVYLGDDLVIFAFEGEDVEARVGALIKQGKTKEQVIAAKPSAEWDATWGTGFMKPDVFLGIVYDSMKKK